MASACLFLPLSGMLAEFVVVAVIIKTQIVSDSYNGIQSCICQTFHLHHQVSIPPNRVMLSGLWTMESMDMCHFQPILGKASTQLSSSPSLKATADKTSCWYGRAVRSLQSQLMGPGYLNISSSLCMIFARQEYWSRLSFPSPGYLLEGGIKSMVPALAGRFFTSEPPGKPKL